MISAYDVCHVVVATVPLYVAMSLAYASVKWWKIFTTEQCEGINKFVAKFSVPLLSFQVISSTNPYKMNKNLIYSDFLQKSMALLVLVVAVRVNRRVTMNWVITCFSLSTLPNTLIIGIPILKAMYRDEAESLLYQIVVLQAVVWNNLLLFLFELNAIEAVSSNPHVENSGEAVADDGQSKEVDQCVVATTRVKPMSILLSVGKKLMINPNFHATLLGLIWAFIHFRVGVDLPEVVNKSILIMSTGGLGMAMFSLGLFMASQPSLISCGVKMALVAMALRCILGPALMAVSSIATGLRGTVFRVAVVQAALPQGIVPFVFAKEYDVHPDILSTGVIFGMVIALPIGLVYYSLLAL